MAMRCSRDRSLRFLANVDPIDVARALDGLDPEETLVVVVSKTFTTAETMLNARTVRSWLTSRLGKSGNGGGGLVWGSGGGGGRVDGNGWVGGRRPRTEPRVVGRIVTTEALESVDAVVPVLLWVLSWCWFSFRP